MPSAPPAPPALRYVFAGNLTIASGATMTVAPNVNIALQPNVTLTDNGTLTFASGDNVNFVSSYGNSEHINVGGQLNAIGLLNATGTSFYNSGSYYNSQIYVGNFGHLQANSCGFSVNNLYLDNGNILNPGDLVNNSFNLPLYVPYSEVQDLSGSGSNNASFQDINILAGTLSSGQLALNAIGTGGTANLRYVFPSNFTIASGATMTVAPNVNIALQPNVTLTDNGTLTFASGDNVNFVSSYGNSEHINVGGQLNAIGLLNATGTSFYNSGSYYNSQIYVGNFGHLQANSCGFSVNNLYLDNGSILNSGDLVSNTFALPLYVPYSEVQNLANNASFQDINILSGTLSSGTVALNAIGTAGTASLRYVFPSNFLIANGGTMTVAANVNILLQPNVTLTDNGTLTFSSGDNVNFASSYGNSEHLNVGGLLNATSTSFYNSGSYFNSQIYIGSGGNLQANYSSFNLNSLYADNNSTDNMSGGILYGVFTINSGAAIAIANNDFSNLGTNALVAAGNPNATINLENNYWGTTVPAQIANIIMDHNKNSNLPTVQYTPFLSTLIKNQPPVLAPISNQTVNEGSTVTLTASATDSDGDTITYSLDPGAPTGAYINPTTGVFTYTPSDGPASYTITVVATDSGTPPLSAVQSFTITVNSVPPTASISGPLDGFQGVRGQVRTFAVSATEPNPIDESGGFTYNINWGDGTPNTVVSGPNNTDVSHIFTATGTYTITATATDDDGATSAPVTTSDTINVVEVQNGTLMIGGTTGNDTFNLSPGSTTNSLAVTVDGTSLGTFSTSGQAVVIGDGGSGDVLNFNDQTDTLADQYLITATSVGRTNAATVSYVGIGTVNVNAGTSANTIDVQSTAAGTPVNITMGNGGDTINVGSSSNTLDTLQGTLSVTGGTGTNTLNLDDQGSTATQTYTIAATTVSRSGAAGITYSKMKKLAVNGSSGTDTDTIVNTASTTPVVVTGGGGATTLVGPNSTSTWTLTGADAGTVNNVTFSGVSNLVGGSGTDTFKFNAAGSLSGTINGGGGSNSLNYSTYNAPVTINLQTGAATATGGMLNITSVTGSTSISNQIIGANTPNTWSIAGTNAGSVNGFSFTAFANLTGGIDTDVFKFSNGKFVSGVINGGGGGDWLDYSAYTTAITVNLATGSATGVNQGVMNIQNVRAGNGGCTLTGDAQGNILIGGTGVNNIQGGSGRSLLIGGNHKGSDTILGGSGDDIIIGGYSTYDTNNAALMSILAEWQRTDETYSQRVNNIKYGGGLNGTNVLVYGSTVKDDLGSDTLTGASGGMNWYFKGPDDTITDLQQGEQVN